MTLSLQAKTSRIAFAVAVLLCTLLCVGLSFRIFLADRDSQSENPASWARAVRLVPENAAYHNQLGRYELLVRGDVAAAVREQDAATHLNPFVANYWFDLARSLQVAGEATRQQQALEQAVLAEPTTPEVAWQAGNFFLVRGETQKALREFRHILESDAIMTPATLEMAWRIEPDAARLLAETIPPKPEVYLEFLRLLVSRKETEASLKVWAKVAELHQPVDAKRAASYVDYLLLQQRPDEALSVWRQLAPLCGLTPYLPNENLIVNPQFELEVLNQGLDWRYARLYNIRLVIDSSEFQDGTKSLMVQFDGPGVNEAGITQFIPVKPNTTYEFAGHYRSDELEGAGGPRFALQDAYTQQSLFLSDELRSPGSWRTAGGVFQTGPSTKLLALRILRVPPGNAIRGKLWIDSLRLIARPAETVTP